MRLTPTYLAVIFAAAAVAIVASFLFLTFSPKPLIDIDVLRTQEATGGVEIKFIRVKITNNSGEDLTNVIVNMGTNDIQKVPLIPAGQAVYITPNSPNAVSKIEVKTDQGISATEYA